MNVVFPAASGGSFRVAILQEIKDPDMHAVWLQSVGNHLRGRGSEKEMFNEYRAAGFVDLSQAAVRLRVSRGRGLYSHIRMCCTFIPPVRDLSSRTGGHPGRQYCRAFHSAVEEHMTSVFVLIGSLFSSLKQFRLANRVLGFETTSARDSAGRRRRARIKLNNGVSVPSFHNVDNFSSLVISWASERRPMGSLFSTPVYIMDSLVQVPCERVGVFVVATGTGAM